MYGASPTCLAQSTESAKRWSALGSSSPSRGDTASQSGRHSAGLVEYRTHSARTRPPGSGASFVPPVLKPHAPASPKSVAFVWPSATSPAPVPAYDVCAPLHEHALW